MRQVKNELRFGKDLLLMEIVSLPLISDFCKSSAKVPLSLQKETFCSNANFNKCFLRLKVSRIP